jgi:hypothetical protein
MSLTLFDEPPVVPEHRIETLARVIAGFRWPDRGSFEKLTKPQQRACLEAARGALERLAAEPD